LLPSEYARDQNLYRAIYIPVLGERAVMNTRAASCTPVVGSVNLLALRLSCQYRRIHRWTAGSGS